MGKNRLFYILFGLALLAIGAFCFLRNVNVSSWGFYHFGKFNSGPLLILLLMADFIAIIAKPCPLTKILMVVLLILLFISIILGIHFRIRTMSAFDFILIAGTIAGGLGLCVKGLVSKN